MTGKRSLRFLLRGFVATCPAVLSVGLGLLAFAGSIDPAKGAEAHQGHFFAKAVAGQSPLIVRGRAVELTLAAVSDSTVRIDLSAVDSEGNAQTAEEDLVLVERAWPPPVLRLRSLQSKRVAELAKMRVTLSPDPLTVRVEGTDGHLIQHLRVDQETGAVTFLIGDGPVFGLGEGGPQFDRRGAAYPMRSGQGAYHLDVFGARVPIPWLIGTTGWAMFVHRPLGSFDLTGKDGRFEPWPSEPALPMDLFVIRAKEPAEVFEEYAALTGFPHLPPIWALGYQQSHRTLVSREEVLSEARTFREKKLPCDVLIYLGTGFCPSGWNTGHGSFAFNPRAFPDPKEMIRELHEEDFRVVLHVVNPPENLHGRVGDTGASAEDESDAARYWAKHLEVLRLGVDGWWPDEGDRLAINPRLARNRMYWEGPQIERPNARPYVLHRNGYAGSQRYGWLWSGDVDSTWKTLEAQVPVGINTSLSGLPFWGTDTGGFVTTKELTGELYVRWFQFSAFCPLFRSHGRTWKLRLPWGWNTGNLGPPELEGYGRNAGVPDTKELLNPEVEPICQKYLNLRSRLMPYLYSIIREAHDTGLPIMRALWLHYPDDPRAVERGDEYLWGRDILVAPVTEKGTTSRKLYLPHGLWYDFWTQTKVEGGREIDRSADLATMPLYVRAGAVLPLGPVKQYTGEKTDEPLTVIVYPGADGKFVMYEDDGVSFDYQKDEFMRLRLVWNDPDRRLTLSLERGSRMLQPLQRKIQIQIPSEEVTRSVTFEGKPVEITF